jgi:hypothetical protein
LEKHTKKRKIPLPTKGHWKSDTNLNLSLNKLVLLLKPHLLYSCEKYKRYLTNLLQKKKNRTNNMNKVRSQFLLFYLYSLRHKQYEGFKNKMKKQLSKAISYYISSLIIQRYLTSDTYSIWSVSAIVVSASYISTFGGPECLLEPTGEAGKESLFLAEIEDGDCLCISLDFAFAELVSAI